MNFKKLLSLIVVGTLLFSACGSRAYAVENAEESTGTALQEPVFYEVQKGDSLWGIAEEFLGDGTRYTDIASWNEETIQDNGLIYSGMRLRIIADTEADSETETEPITKDTFTKTLEERAMFGTIIGSSWENEWLRMRFDLPEGFQMENADEFFSDYDEDEEDSEDDGIIVDAEFVVESTELPSTIAYFGLTLWDDSVEEFMEEIKSIEEEVFDDGLGTDMEWRVGGTVEFGGRTFEHFTASSELWGFGIYQDYYVTQQDDVVCFFYTIYIDGMGSDPKVLLDSFSEY